MELQSGGFFFIQTSIMSALNYYQVSEITADFPFRKQLELGIFTWFW